MRSQARLLLLHTRPHTTGFQLLNHQGLSDLFSEYLLSNVMCRTTETIESMETLMDQGKVNAECEGEIRIKMQINILVYLQINHINNT